MMETSLQTGESVIYLYGMKSQARFADKKAKLLCFTDRLLGFWR